MPCPTQEDLNYADALVVVAYDNMQAAQAEMNASTLTWYNSQSTYYAASYYASSLWMEWMMCNQGVNMGFSPGDSMASVGINWGLMPPAIVNAVNFCREFENDHSQIAAGLRLLHRQNAVDAERERLLKDKAE